MRYLGDLVLVARPRQWVKNSVCLAPLLFSGFLVYPDSARRALICLLCFCFSSSAIYIFNDILDRRHDQAHPAKRHRPIAAGRLPGSVALMEAAVLVVMSLSASLLLSSRFRWLLVSFLLLHSLYSLRLKSVAILDVMSIALGFVVRVQAGIEAIECPQSAWIVLCMFFIALLLGFGKRRGELTSPNTAALRDHRPVLAAYSVAYLDILLGLSAATALVCYSIYSIMVQANETFLVTILPVAFGIARYMMLAVVQTGGECPDEVLMRDVPLVLTMALWTALCIGVLYFDFRLFS